MLRDWFTNTSYAWPIIIIMGVVATFSFYFVFSAYSIASPSAVSLFEYSLIIMSMIPGYILFNEMSPLLDLIIRSLHLTALLYVEINKTVGSCSNNYSCCIIDSAMISAFLTYLLTPWSSLQYNAVNQVQI